MDPSQGSEEPKPRGGYAIWFAGAVVAVGGMLLVTYQTKPLPVPDDDPRERRSGLVAAPAAPSSSLTRPLMGVEGPGSLTPQAQMPLQRPQNSPVPLPEDDGTPPGVAFSRALLGHRAYYSQMAQKHAESQAVRNFFQEWNRAPDLAMLSRAYYKDGDAIKFAQGAVLSPRFAPLMKRYTLEPDIRAYGMELIMGSPQDVLTAWTNYAAKDPEGSRLQTEFFNAMGVPPQLAQIMGNGQTGSADIATQVKALLPGLLGGLDPKILQQVQQQQQQQGNPR